MHPMDDPTGCKHEWLGLKCRKCGALGYSHCCCGTYSRAIYLYKCTVRGCGNVATGFNQKGKRVCKNHKVKGGRT